MIIILVIILGETEVKEAQAEKEIEKQKNCTSMQPEMRRAASFGRLHSHVFVKVAARGGRTSHHPQTANLQQRMCF